MSTAQPSPTRGTVPAPGESTGATGDLRAPSFVAAVEAPPWKVAAAFAAVYVIWGSTYLAIRFAIETLPPFLMAGTRFLVAGAVLYAWTRRGGRVARPSGEEWRTAVIVGGLLLLGGNGAVVWAEQHVPSGLVALLVATVPLFMVAIDRMAGGERPRPLVLAGIAWGLAGVGLLVGGEELAGGTGMSLLGGVAVLLGALLWAAGSIYSRRAPLPASPRLGTAMQMLAGGTLLLAAGAGTGELARLDPTAVSLRSFLALGYLVVFGSLVAFSAYIWLLRAVSPARVSTYAYVNPVVALFLGWALADEPLGLRTLVAAAVILSAVMVINLLGRTGRARHGGSSGGPQSSTMSRA